jgi:nicotinamidase-related amidase
MNVSDLWQPYLTDLDRAVVAQSGLGQRMGFGKRTALLIIDVTTNFCGERREPILMSIKSWRNSCGEAAWDAIERISELRDHARAAGVPIIYSAGLKTDSNPVLSGRWRDKNSRRDEDADASRRTGHDIVAELTPLPGEIVIRKTKPSVFFGTPLHSYLVDLGIDTIIACGGSTSGCVRATVIDGFSCNYRMVVAADACFDRITVSHAVTMFDLDQKYADVMSTVDVLGALSRKESSTDAS